MQVEDHIINSLKETEVRKIMKDKGMSFKKVNQIALSANS